LCALCALAPHLNAENATELFGVCRGKTRRQIEEVLAARFPRPDVREQIRRLPARGPIPAAAAERISPPSRAIAEPVSARTASETPSIARNPVQLPVAVPALASDARRRAREIEPLSAARFGVHFTADAELRDLIECARALAGHRLPNGDLAALIKLMAASFVRQEEKRRFGIGARPRRTKITTRIETKAARPAERGTPPGGAPLSPRAAEPTAGEARAVPAKKRSRYLGVAVRREAHLRDHGRCAFVSTDGRRCTARARLELDHIEPFARLGTGEARTIRLLCRAHNLLHARKCFGALHLAAKIAAKNRPLFATHSR
jgi:hypothetical protein